jgi:hypothetical protein
LCHVAEYAEGAKNPLKNSWKTNFFFASRVFSLSESTFYPCWSIYGCDMETLAESWWGWNWKIINFHVVIDFHFLVCWGISCKIFKRKIYLIKHFLMLSIKISFKSNFSLLN